METFDWAVSACAPRAQDDGSVALVATQNFEAGEVILRVPSSECLTADAVADLDAVRALPPDTPAWVQLAVAIAALRVGGGGGRWGPYIRATAASPGLARLHPVAWSATTLDALEGTQTFATLASYRAFVEAAWNDASVSGATIPAGDDVSDDVDFDAFLWGFGFLKANALPPFGELADLRIVPGLHLVRHGRDATCAIRAAGARGKGGGLLGGLGGGGNSGEGGDAVELVATRAIAQGAPLLADLGPGRPETAAFLDLGALCLSRPVVGVELTLELMPSDRNLDDKCDVLEINGLAPQSTFRVMRGVEGGEGGEAIPSAMMAYLRLFHLGGADAFLLESIFRNDVWGFLLEPVSAENEAAVCTSMIDHFSATLATFPREGKGEGKEGEMEGEGDGEGREGALARAVLGLESEGMAHVLSLFQAEREGEEDKEYYHERRLKSLGLLDMDGEYPDL